MNGKLTIALTLLAILAGRAESYPASQGGIWRYQGNPCNGVPSGYVYGSANVACSANVNTAAQGFIGACGNPTWTGVITSIVDTVSGYSVCTGNVISPSGTVAYSNIALGNVDDQGYRCANGGTLNGATCVCAAEETDTSTSCILTPSDSDKNAGICPGVFTGKPINVGTGNKVLAETDYRASAATSLEWRRTYNHLISRSGGPVLSTRWTHSYSRWIVSSGTTAYLFKADGRVLRAQLFNSAIINGEQTWTPDSYATDRLMRRF